MRTSHYLALLVILVSLTRSCYGLGEACTADDSSNCTGTGVVCGGSITCVCDSNHYPFNGGCTEKIGLGFSGCTNGNAASECADDNTECIAGVCKCISTHYDNNGDTSRGKCDERTDLNFIMARFRRRSKNVLKEKATSTYIGDRCKIPTGGPSASVACDLPNSICTSTDHGDTCQCDSGYYQSNAATCSAEASFGEPCTVHYNDVSVPCSGMNVECHRSRCICKLYHYRSDVNICSAQAIYGESCTVYSNDFSSPCHGTNVECDGLKCICKSNHYRSDVNICSAIGANLGSGCTIPTPGSESPATNACATVDAECRTTRGSPTCQCISTHYATRGTCQQKKKLGEACSTSQDCTSSDSNSECSGRKCQCQSSFYDDNGETAEGTCASKVNLEGTCTAATSGAGDPCNAESAVCTGSGYFYTCKCQGGYYKSDTNTCSEVGIGLGSGCTVPDFGTETTVRDACSVANAECRIQTGSSPECQCISSHYQADTLCKEIKQLGDVCSTRQDCTSSDSNSACSGRKCQCQSSYYDDNGNTGGGTCASKVNLESACSVATLGSSDPCNTAFAVCTRSRSSYTCKCQRGYYKSGGNTCSKVGLALGSSCTIPTSESGTTITDACTITFAECRATSDASPTTCQCTDTHYTFRSECRKRQQLGEKCSGHMDCISFDANSMCGNGLTCQCRINYYDSDGSNNIGGTCTSSKELGEECDVPTECSGSAAVCTGSNKVCTCGSKHYDDNGFSAGGNCQEISQLQVSSITFSQVHTTSMIVSWTPQRRKASFINYYTVQWASNDSSIAEGVKENIISTTTKITGLTPGQNYRITVTSVNKVTQADSPRSTFVSKQRSAKPMPPSSLDLDGSNLDATDKEISLAWTRPSSGVVSRYDIEVLDGTELKQSIFAVRTASATFTFNDMRNGYAYNVEIISRSETYDGSKTEPSEPFKSTFKTDVQVPAPPTDVFCLRIYDEYITLSWTAPQKPNGDLVQYVVHTLSYSSNTETFKKNTSSTGTTYDVHGLEPGTAYVFRVYTQNEGHTSTQYGVVQHFCTTKARMADKPQNLNFVNNITSRALSVTWSEPVNIYSSENLGYIVQLQDNDANMCEKEIVMRCSNCTTGDIKNITMSRCGQDLQVQIDQPHDEIRANKLYTIQGFLPDTNYTVSVSVVNNHGKGHAASIDIKTPEEEPQAAPVVRPVYDIRKNSFNVSWSLIGPRPGQVTYTVILTADTGADSKTYDVTGYGNTNLFADGLEEYWNYDVSVTARTNAGGAKTSDTTTKYRTLPSAPGAVTMFGAVKVQLRTDNFHKMTIQWKAPLLLQRNSVIKEYVLKHNVGNTTASSGDGEEFKTMSFTSVTSDVFYSQEFDVIPELTYQFEVYAVNTESTDNMGEKTTIKEIAPAGFPVSIEEADKTLQVVKEGSKDQTFISLNLVREFFTEDTNGRVQRTALLGCKNSACPENFLGYADTQKKVDALANWQKAAQNGLYRITTADWLAKNKRRRRSKYTEVPYTVGIENCDGVTDSTYCNGPLEPETEYLFVAVVCTSTGCTVSKKYGPYITEAVPPPIGMIVGIVVGVVAALVVVVIVVLFLRRRSRNKAIPMSTIPDGILVEVEIEGKIQRKRPILLSEFDAYLTMMHKDSNLKFSDEYEDLKTLSPKHSTVASDLEENRAKNRYINIIPYDHSRVKLTTNEEDDKNDFINGNYLPGYLSPREYIGCQGPLPATIDDHWRMIWEQNVTIIVMLTLCKEGKKIKCEQYWPDEVGDPKQYGEVVVEMTSYSNIKTYDFRVFKIRNGSQTCTIKHFHFLTWQDFQANVKHDTILNFIRDVRHQIQPPDKAGPMIVHCSAGVGRTGTYLAIDYFMQFIDEHDFDVEIDIFDFVLRMRDNRIFMVQTEEQYVFIHDCVKEMLDSKRLAENNLYENTGGNQEGDLYQNTSQQLYENVQYNSSDQRTEL